MPDPTGRVSHLADMHRGVSWKQPVRAATTASITIASALNAGDTIDGVTLADGDRVLVKDQGTGSQNGLYVTAGTPFRAFDMDQDGATSVPASEIVGAFVYVSEGTTNGGTLWYSTNTGTPTVGSTSIAWEQFAVGGPDTSLVTANTGTAYDIDVSAARTYDLTVNSGTAVLTLSGAVTAEAWYVTVLLRQDGTGSRLVTWPGSVEWPGGVTPTLSTDADAVDVFTLFTLDGGTVWFGFPTGGGGAALSTDTPEPVGTTGAAGSSVEGSPSDHVHAIDEATVQAIGHYELLMVGASPPEPLEDGTGTDWLWVWVNP